ncbi:MAG: cyclic nucleotide-gated ion channel/potassium channel family protein [Pseudomonadota bacterium]|nr:cyclic nucleotide-gated ion channel/potassium channel family protein [Pseudomonadota bacterium]
MPAEEPARTLRRRVFDVLESGRRGGRAARLIDYSLLVLIIANVAVAVLDTVASIHAEAGDLFQLFDRLCVAVFAVEYGLRLWTAPEHAAFRKLAPAASRLRFATTPFMIIDLIALLPFLAEIALGSDLAVVRVVRVIRFLRLTRYSPALATVGRVLADNWRALAGSGVLFSGLLILSSVLMYFAEGRVQPDALGNVPKAMWWAVVTLSTVGYGDVLPVTLVGKVIAGLTMVMGIMFFALPVGIIATGFLQEIQRRDFVVSFGMVARVPLFVSLDAPMIAQLVGLLNAKKVAAGAIVVRKGDEADGMYFIASGEVEVDIPAGPVRLGEGDFFGEIALIEPGARRTATVTAVRPSELLVLDVQGFHRLMGRSPLLAEAVKDVASQRLRALEKSATGVGADSKNS